MMRWAREEQTLLAPTHFFALSTNCPQKGKEKVEQEKFLLPLTSEMFGEDEFADVYMAWDMDGLSFHVTSHAPMRYSDASNPSRGDSVELYIDTRDVKNAGVAHRFCHHFFFLPQVTDGKSAGEITRFRTEDIHELCDPSLLQCKTTSNKKGYSMEIHIPSEALFSYEPNSMDRLGFTYRINRGGGTPQHFAVSSEEFAIEQNPSLWATVRLTS